LQEFEGSVITLIEDAKHSAARLVNLLADHFLCFSDEGKFERKKVRFLKRAQIFVADLWAAFDGQEYGQFDDIDKITMFAGQTSILRKKCLKLTSIQITAFHKCSTHLDAYHTVHHWTTKSGGSRSFLRDTPGSCRFEVSYLHLPVCSSVINNH
jgi:hypothetical protein